jgi:hypothetical protein
MFTVESLDRDHQHTMGIHHRDSGIAFAQPEGCMPILGHRAQMAHPCWLPTITPSRHRQRTEFGHDLKTVDRPSADRFGVNPAGQARRLSFISPGSPTLDVTGHRLQSTATMSDLSRRLLRKLPRLLNTPLTRPPAKPTAPLTRLPIEANKPM